MSRRSSYGHVDPIELSRSNSDQELNHESFTTRFPEIKTTTPKTFSYTKEVVYKIKEKKHSRNSMVVKGSYWFKVMTIIRIQSLARRYLVRKVHAMKTEKAMVIQRAVRYYLSNRYTDLERIIMVQSLYRRKCATMLLNKMKNDIIKEYLKRKMRLSKSVAATHIQALFRGYMVRRNLTAKDRNAVRIQQVYRGYIVRNVFKRDVRDIILVQSLHRKVRAERKLKEMKRAILKDYAQRSTQNYKVEVDQVKYSDYLIKYVLLLQAFFRGCMARKSIKELTLSAAKIQQAWESYLCRRQENLQAQSIQRVYRGHLERKKLLAQVLVVSVIQRLYRGSVDRKKFEAMKLKESSATTIQRVYRGHKTRKLYDLNMESSATTIQRIYRGYDKKISYDKKLKAVVTIQSLALGYCARQKLSAQQSKAIIIQRMQRKSVLIARFKNTLNCVILIQSMIRSFLVRKEIESRNSRATIIQRSYRGYATRSKHWDQIRICIVLQSLMRGFLARKELAVQESCAKIQKLWRCFKQRRNYVVFLSSIVISQSLVRRWLANKCVKRIREKNRSMNEDFFNIHLFQLANCTGDVDIELCLDNFDGICVCDKENNIMMQSQITV